MESNVVFDISPPSHIWQNSSPQIGTANQIAGFFKIKYLKNKMNDEVCFLHADKHQSLVQVDTIILGVCNQACPKYPK